MSYVAGVLYGMSRDRAEEKKMPIICNSPRGYQLLSHQFCYHKNFNKKTKSGKETGEGKCTKVMQCTVWAIWKADDALHLPRLLLSLNHFIFTGSPLSFSHPATFLVLPFWFSFHHLLFFRGPEVLCRTGNLIKFQEQHFFF